MSDKQERPSFANLPRANCWQLRTRKLQFSKLPKLMGILNITPDSFSDGGQFLNPQEAVDRAVQLVEDGADLLDLGGESTRPYAAPVDPQEEARRVKPVLDLLVDAVNVPISIDTSKASVARLALDAGAEIINDVTGLEGDPEMVPLAVMTEAGVCAMHMQGTPQTMQNQPDYRDVVVEIGDYLRRRREQLLEAGILESRICLDPGIGFGKTHQHNLTLMANCHQFHQLGVPLLVGHSRKGFLAKVVENVQEDRTWTTVGAALSLAIQGVQVIRVHDVRPVREALLAFGATGGLDGNPAVLEASSTQPSYLDGQR